MLDVLYNLIYTLPICVSAISLGRKQFELDQSSRAIYMLALLCCLYFVALGKLRLKMKTAIVGITAMLLGLVVLVQKPDKRVDFINDNMWVLTIILIAFISYVAGLLIANIKIIRRVTGIAAIALLVAAMIMKIKLNPLGVSTTFLTLIIMICEEIQLAWDKDGYTDRKKHIMYLMPFLLGLLFVVRLTPIPSKPYGWGFAKAIMHKIDDSIEGFVSLFKKEKADEYDDFLLGFSDGNEMSASVDDSGEPSEVMTIESNGDYGKKLYLIGKVYDTFDGKKWISTDTEDADDRMLDALELYSGVCTYDGYNISNYVRLARIKITYTNIDTKYVFAPCKTYTEEGGLKDENIYQEGGTLLFEKMHSDDAYSIDYLYMNRDSKEFLEFANAEEKDNNNVWRQVIKRKGYAEDDNYTYSKLVEHRNHIKENYTEEIKLSEQLRAYMDKVYEGANTDYEKLLRLEDMFSEFIYTLSPKPIPDYVNSAESFLDYFIFESKEGYCIHYATAFTLLARAEGIPVRYVQGFYASMEKGKSVRVSSDMAHAWPEAYLEGIGWLSFEPTPGFKVEFSWGITENSQSQTPDVPDMDSTTEEQQQEEKTEKSHNAKKILVNIIIAIIVMISAIILFIVYLIVDVKIEKKRYEKKSVSDKYKYMCKKNMNLLKEFEIEIQHGETLEEFAERVAYIEKCYDEEVEKNKIDSKILGYIGSYETVIYSKQQATEEMLVEAETSNHMMNQLLKARSKTKYIMNKLRK